MARKRAVFRLKTTTEPSPNYPYPNTREILVEGGDISVDASGVLVDHEDRYDGPYTFYPLHLIVSPVEVTVLSEDAE